MQKCKKCLLLEAGESVTYGEIMQYVSTLDKADLADNRHAGAQGDIAHHVIPAIIPGDGRRRIGYLIACPRKYAIWRKAIDRIACLWLFGVVVAETCRFDGLKGV